MQAQFHTVNVVSAGVEVTNREDGSQLVRSTAELAPYAEKITDKLIEWAAATPDTNFFCQRNETGAWECITYAQTLERVRALATWMLKQELSAERPVVILSGNSTEHLLVGLAAMYIGVPYAPISTAYSLISSDFGKLKHIFEVLTPGLIFAENLGPYRAAIDSCNTANAPVVTCSSDDAIEGVAYRVTLMDQLFNETDLGAVEAAHARVNGDTIAKFLFTSGSTGMPKAVINTQRMLCANQVMINSTFAFLQHEKPVILDWLPWNHTFGGNHNVGIALYNGGTFYIDEGKPVPKLIHHTLSNLKEISPTIYFNVPKGYELLVKELRADREIAKSLFKRLNMFFFAGAGLAQHVWDQLDQLSVEITGKKVPMLTGLGATETAPSAMFTSIEGTASGVIGLPCPGVELKLVTNDDKTEVRVRAETVTPGYWRNEEQTLKAFDEEGFYCFGDAVKWIDEKDPNRGMLFDGRVSEDFKLDSGTWVSVGTLRVAIINHFAPYIQDAVICGRDKGFITAMLFPDFSHLQRLVPQGATMDNVTLVAQPQVVSVMQECLQKMAKTSTGSSTRITRITLLTEPPSIDGHELTDKGSINQRAVITRREDIMNTLYAENIPAHVISL